MGDYNVPIIEPTIDFTQILPINQKRTITFINHFIVHTITFLNKFALTCEEKLFEFENKLQRVQASLEILESRLSSIPGLEIKTETQDLNQKQKVKTVVVIEGKDEPDKEISKKTKNEDIEPEPQPINANSRYQKYFKMLHFGVPKPAVKLKMEQEGLNSSLLEQV